MKSFDKEVAKIGMAQNKDKMIAVLALAGPGSRNAIRELAAHSEKVPFACTLATKSLGSIVTANASAGQEVSARIIAMKKARYQANNMWNQPGLPWKLRRLSIICQVVNAGLSGLEAFVLSDRQLLRIDAGIAVACKSALRGEAISRSGRRQGNISDVQQRSASLLGPCHSED